jgi:DNA-binding transcriptional regulator GbsR (MarR family)
MSETSATETSPLSGPHRAAREEFVRLWGEMASQWGINRTMALLHALLFASGEPLDTDEIMEELGISRGNANMNLRALLDWGLVRKTQRPGSRKDYFEAELDVWRITTIIIEERQRREIVPVQHALSDVARDLRSEGAASDSAEAFANRVDQLVGVMEVLDAFTRAVLPLVRGRRGEDVQKLVRFASRLRSGA